MRITTWKTKNAELARQLAELERQFIKLATEFEAYRKAHP